MSYSISHANSNIIKVDTDNEFINLKLIKKT